MILRRIGRDKTVLKNSGNSHPAVDSPRGLDEQCATIARKLRLALRPIERDGLEPPSDGTPEIPRTAIVLGTELMNQARWSEQADPFDLSRGMTAPGEPQIKIETAGGVCQSSNGMPLGGNGMDLNFSPELFTQLDSIDTLTELLTVIFAGIPDAHPIKKTKSSASEELLRWGLPLVPEGKLCLRRCA